ncbi:MAG TPA: 4-hydroxythreonine-4-phosphate dehydrogenase PdxA [Steroidobacteraceae bacterium]|jgi:4-hydroxythreonine-4-phosphate dehydrogenase|nr:4-hydroxythreonine-4-phosphate dehydrogenase PdxA [Steroidobacteraceae bacterium]
MSSSSPEPWLPRIVLTSGEPAGVGPELCLAVAQREFACELVCLADGSLLEERARSPGPAIALRPYGAHARRAAVRERHRPGTLLIEHASLRAPSAPAQPDRANAPYVLALLDRAIDGALAGEFDAVVTAPVHKQTINEAGVAFSGHTEYFAQRAHAPQPVMMLTAGTLRVALATTHLPLAAVSAALSVDSLCATAGILARELERCWSIRAPRIAVCGLNPHAGEGGYLGDEEQRVIAPAIERMRQRGIDARGPLPADTVFVPQVLAGFDAVLAMYHDQGLPVVKHAGFDRAVNVTLGLPFVRTSVDHGTAFALAGSGRADPGSLVAAVQLAVELAARRR